MVGSILAGLELADQAAARGIRPDVVVLPTATGGTQAGLLVGLALAGLPTRTFPDIPEPRRVILDEIATRSLSVEITIRAPG